jgi:hypothetical protein
MSEIHWLNAVNGSFTNPADWSGGVVPGSTDDALLDAVGSTPYTVTASAIEMVNSLQTDANATLLMTRGYIGDANGTGAGENAGVILIGPAATFVAGGEVSNSGLISVYGSAGTFVANGGVYNSGHVSIAAAGTFAASGAVDNTGTILIDGGASGATFQIKNAATFSGGGQIVLGAGGHDRLGSSGANLLNVDNTITGGGQILGAAVNGVGGVIDATSSSGLKLSGGALHNSGLLEATKSGVLELSTTIVNDNNAMISAAPKSTVQISGHVSGGTLVAAGSGTMVVDGYMSSVTLRGTVQSTGVNLGSRLQNTGTLNVSGSLDAFRVYINGGGLINLGAYGSIGMYDNYGDFVNIDNRIVGGSQIGAGSSRFHFINEMSASVTATRASGMTIGFAGDTIINAGTIQCETAGGIHFGTSLQNTGTIIADQGTITITGAVSGSGFIELQAGTALIAQSTFNEFVVFAGGSGYVQLANSRTYSGAIVGFSRKGGTTLDLLDITLGGGTEALYAGGKAGGVLTVTDQIHTAHINLQGNFLDCAFNVSSDGHGGVLVTATKGAALFEAPSVHGFISAMAGFGGPGAAEVLLGQAWSIQASRLAAPRTSLS